MDAALARDVQPEVEVTSDAWSRAVPNLIVFFSNLAIMVIELVASRLVARYIGSSLYTRTSVIGVILAGMSIGNHLGGRLADREAPQRVLPYLFLSSAALALAVLWTNDLAGHSSILARLPWPARIFGSV